MVYKIKHDMKDGMEWEFYLLCLAGKIPFILF